MDAEEKDKLLREIIGDIIRYTIIYYPQLYTGRTPDELYGLIAALRSVNSKRDYPDIVITNFNILWDNEKYKELLDYLIKTYI